jgi:trk system potassium uptake protein TrkH
MVLPYGGRVGRCQAFFLAWGTRLKSRRRSERFTLFAFFITLIFLGTILLQFPFAWGQGGRIKIVDSLFTATSAVCVTGLITVNTADFSFWGQLIILMLIQTGGLGIISFTTLYIIFRGRKISLYSRNVIRSYSIHSVEFEPTKIVRQIVLLTFSVEAIGAVLLYLSFRRSLSARAVFASIFHSVSAFCNAGFSIFRNSLEDYAADPAVSFTVMGLIVLGGLGFIVFVNIGKTLRTRNKNEISYHTKIVLIVTSVLLVTATLLYFLFERRNALAGLNLGQKITAALFQAVTPRTAGFNTIPQDSLSFPSKLLTLPLMFIGGAPGSIAGGIKVTTIFLVLMLVIRERDFHDEVKVLRRKISSQVLSDASTFTIRAFLILFISFFLLTITENLTPGSRASSFFPLMFESFSAFGTVGLSMGVTPSLTTAGKLIIIFTMFAGRVGLISMAMGLPEKFRPHEVDYPKGEVMIG